jgi:hypothetical protein
MTSHRIPRRTPAVLTALAITATLAASAGAAVRGHAQAQRFTLYTANLHGRDLPAAVEAAGAVTGVGTETQTDHDTAGGQINRATLHFAAGTIRLIAPEKFAWKPNLASCSATANGHGTYTITGGTGAYRGATGHGSFTSHGVLLGARSKSGACLGQKAMPTANYVTVTLSGTIDLAG